MMGLLSIGLSEVIRYGNLTYFLGPYLLKDD
jgi:hypothetical protein